MTSDIYFTATSWFPGKCPRKTPFKAQCGGGQIMPNNTTGPPKVFHLPASLSVCWSPFDVDISTETRSNRRSKVWIRFSHIFISFEELQVSMRSTHIGIFTLFSGFSGVAWGLSWFQTYVVPIWIPWNAHIKLVHLRIFGARKENRLIQSITTVPQNKNLNKG